MLLGLRMYYRHLLWFSQNRYHEMDSSSVCKYLSVDPENLRSPELI